MGQENTDGISPGMNWFPTNIHTYVITLPESPERTQRTRDHFKERGFTNYEFFNGIHAEKFGLRTVWPYELDNPGSGFNVGFRIVGCWLSHYMLWQALLMRHDDHYHIMESDVKLPIYWQDRMNAAMTHVPADFDMLYTGSCCCKGHPMMDAGGGVFKMLGGTGPQCTHSYIVARKALPVILETQRKCYAPIDVSLILHSHPRLKVFVVLPSIVDQFDTELPP